jgi:mRNA interferase MazF
MKDFDQWNDKKKEIERRTRLVLYKPGEVWWCSLGLNVGNEEDGKNENFERPVLIIAKFGEENCIGVPLTSVPKDDRFHVPLNILDKNSRAIVSQIRFISTKRFIREMGTITKQELRTVKDRLYSLIG